jgi:hypothetical protein
MSTHWRRLPILAALILSVVACANIGAPAPSADPGTGLAITATAGPTCPVETIPPDPACAARPVAGATIIIVDPQGKTVATVVTDARGVAVVALPPGAYTLQPQAVEGLMGTADVQNVAIVAGAIAPVAVTYDTGIR